jgi:hypothetical protein
MKISLKDLRPNPYRDSSNYPIHREKIEALKASIRSTGFWDNILVRKAPEGEHYEIAYGHHRLVALQELSSENVIEENFEFEAPVRQLDEATMVRIMANENANEYRLTSDIVDETIRVAREFIQRDTKTPLSEITASDISQFLGGSWNEDKVAVSLQRLGLFDRGTLQRDMLKGLSHTAARSIQREVAKVEKLNFNDKIAELGDEEEPTNQERKRVRSQVQRVANHVAKKLTDHVRNGGTMSDMREKSIDAQVELIPEDAKGDDAKLSTIDAAAASVSPRDFQRKVELLMRYSEHMSRDAKQDLLAKLKELSSWCKTKVHELEGTAG